MLLPFTLTKQNTHPNPTYHSISKTCVLFGVIKILFGVITSVHQSWFSEVMGSISNSWDNLSKMPAILPPKNLLRPPPFWSRLLRSQPWWPGSQLPGSSVTSGQLSTKVGQQQQKKARFGPYLHTLAVRKLKL